MRECDFCNGGVIEAWEDCYSYSTGHYTRDWSEPCPKCCGTGRLPDSGGMERTYRFAREELGMRAEAAFVYARDVWTGYAEDDAGAA